MSFDVVRSIHKVADQARTGISMSWQRVFATLWSWRWAIGLAVSIAVGIVFRLIWLSDMEYKQDEAWTVEQVQAFWHTHHLLPAGMSSSAGPPNAGLSLWVFIALSALLPIDDP